MFKPALGEDKQRKIFLGVPTKLVPEMDVGQLDLFKTEELLCMTRIPDVWGAIVLVTQRVWKPHKTDSRISVLDVST